jgi:hypothetical protein
MGIVMCLVLLSAIAIKLMPVLGTILVVITWIGIFSE